MFAAAIHLMGGDMRSEEVAEHARIAFEIAERLGDAFSRTWARYWVGYAALVSGDLKSAVENLNRALNEIEERGAGREASAGIHSNLGSALVATGEVERGIESRTHSGPDRDREQPSASGSWWRGRHSPCPSWAAARTGMSARRPSTSVLLWPSPSDPATCSSSSGINAHLERIPTTA